MLGIEIVGKLLSKGDAADTSAEGKKSDKQEKLADKQDTHDNEKLSDETKEEESRKENTKVKENTQDGDSAESGASKLASKDSTGAEAKVDKGKQRCDDKDQGHDQTDNEEDSDKKSGEKECDDESRKRSLHVSSDNLANSSCSSEEEPGSPGDPKSGTGTGTKGQACPSKAGDAVSAVKRRSTQAKKRLKKEQVKTGDGAAVTDKNAKPDKKAAVAGDKKSDEQEADNRRKRKPEAVSPDHTQSQNELPELPKRLKQGVDSSEEQTPTRKVLEEGDESDIAVRVDASPDTNETTDDSSATAAGKEETPKKKNLLVDFVHSPAHTQISSLVEITRGHDLITSALPSSSLHSSQEDLTTAPSSGNDGAKVIDDYAKLKQDQAKTLRRAKDMLKAAFSESESDSGSEDEAGLSSKALPDSDAEMPAPPPPPPST